MCSLSTPPKGGSYARCALRPTAASAYLLWGLWPGIVLGTGGCVTGSLASSTGPRPPGHRWSVAPRQPVHVGETVQFDFVLQDAFRRLVDATGRADYCAAIIAGERVESMPDATGHFHFEHTFADLQPGQRVEVRVFAYRQLANKDFMRIGGVWMRSESPYEESDRKVASDALTLVAYQAEIELPVVRPADDLDVETGVLRLHRTEGTSAVFVDKPGRPGFTMSGPDAGGFYHVRYRPQAGQLNPFGTTDVEFAIYDTAGRRHEKVVTVPTP
ncbi:MAG: hypothetical protein HY763_05330 [Planctomycetes bacterium]|nr:hypothetical protein [Planctomycetota bacterium]